MTPRLYPHRAPRGVTLIEMMVALAVAALLFLIAAPKLNQAVIGSNVRSARGAVSTLFNQARASAVSARRTTTLRFATDSVWITQTQGGGEVRVGSARNFLQDYGASVASTADVVILPTGLLQSTTGASVVITRGSVADTLTISGMGRVQ